VPVVNLYEKDKWAPDSKASWFRVALMVWRWFEIISGYVLSGLALAGVTGLGIRKEWRTPRRRRRGRLYRDRAILKTYLYTGVRLATACRRSGSERRVRLINRLKARASTMYIVAQRRAVVG
jgi:hypothetical protein